MLKNICVYINWADIFNKKNQNFNEDYVNISLKFAKYADLTVVISNTAEFDSNVEEMCHKLNNANVLVCDFTDNTVFNKTDAEVVFVISSIYKEVKIENNVIKFSLDFDSIQNRYLNTSFVELAKQKLIYNYFSDEFSFLIDKNTYREFDFLHSLLIKNGITSGELLDCCCGVGRHDILLSNQGYNIFGIDISENQIATANKTNKNERVQYIVGDIRNFLYTYQQFDAAICMWTSFNYLNKNEMKDFISNVYNGLKEKSVFILDTKNFISPLEYKLYLKSIENDTKKVEIFVLKRIKNKIQTSKYIYSIYDKLNKKTDFFIDNELVNIYTKEDIADIVKNKFSVSAAYGDYNFTHYTRKSDRMILVLKRL